MIPEQSDSKTDPPAAQRPWGAIVIGVFLVACGIGASIYSYIALTWAPESTSEVVYVKSESDSTTFTNDPSDASQKLDGVIETSTTRRRSTPGYTPKTTKAPATTNDDNSGSYDEDDEDDEDESEEDDSDDDESEDDTGASNTGVNSESNSPDDIGSPDNQNVADPSESEPGGPPASGSS